jgi:hypothetical protein
MKTLIIALALSLFAAPAFAACHKVGVGTSDQPNHQSSLSSTTAGGATYM